MKYLKDEVYNFLWLRYEEERACNWHRFNPMKHHFLGFELITMRCIGEAIREEPGSASEKVYLFQKGNRIYETFGSDFNQIRNKHDSEVFKGLGTFQQAEYTFKCWTLDYIALSDLNEAYMKMHSSRSASKELETATKNLEKNLFEFVNNVTADQDTELRVKNERGQPRYHRRSRS